MFRTVLCALAIAALTLTSTVVIAKNGGNTGTGNRGPSAGQQTSSGKPDFAFKKMRILHCGKYGRSDGEGGVTMVTVCN
jgi:hypothetical protein